MIVTALRKFKIGEKFHRTIGSGSVGNQEKVDTWHVIKKEVNFDDYAAEDSQEDFLESYPGGIEQARKDAEYSARRFYEVEE